MKTAKRPLPEITDTDRPFWEGLREHRVVVQQCTACDTLHHPPRLRCPHCHSEEMDWTEIAPAATVWSFVVFHKPYVPALMKGGPYNVVIAELEGGIRMFTSVPKDQQDQLRVGMALSPEFTRLTDEVTLLTYRLAEDSQTP